MGDRATLKSSPYLQDFIGNRFYTLLPYESYDKERQLFFNGGSIGFVIKGAPLVGANLEDQNRLADFFREAKHLPEGASLQVLLQANPQIGPLLNWWESHRDSSNFHDLAQKRTDFFKNMAFHAYHPIRDFQLWISYSLPWTTLDSIKEIHLLETRRVLLESLESIGFAGHVMEGEEFLGDMVNLLHPSHDLLPQQVSWNPHESLRRQMILPDAKMDVREDLLDSGEWTWKGFVPSKLPQMWALGYMDRFLGELLTQPQSLPGPFWIHYGLYVASNQAKERIVATTKRESLENSLKSQLTKWMPQLREQYEESLEVLEELQRGERVVLAGLCVGLVSKKGDEIRNEQTFRSLWTKLGWEFRETRFDHLPVKLSCLPMTWTWNERKKFFKQKSSQGYGPCLFNMGLIKKTVTRESQNLLPLIGEWKGQFAPGMMLTGRRGQLFFWNPFSSALLPNAANPQTDHNYNVCIAGQSGSGKSVFMNELMTTTLGIGGRVFVLDFGRSFKKSCQLLQGQHIEFDLKRPISLNPFTHIPEGNDALSFENREEMLATLKPVLQVMAAPKHGTTDLQNSYIDQALRKVWEQKGAKSSIADVFNLLLNRDEQAAKDIGQMLFSFTNEGSYGKFFEGMATVNLNSQLVVIETDHLRNHPELMSVVVQMMILQINQTMTMGDRKTPFLIIIDEAWKLLQGKDSAAFISEATRTARKYKGSIVLATQHLTDYFKPESPAATEAFNCSAWKCILYQEADVIESLSHHNQLKSFIGNEWQKNILKSIHSKPPHYSEVCIFGPRIHGVVGRLRLDPFTRVLYSTNADEYRKVEEGLHRGLSITRAIEAVIEKEKP